MLQIDKLETEILLRIDEISQKVDRKWRAPGAVKG